MTRLRAFGAAIVLALSLSAPSSGEEAATFEPGPQNDPETCRDIWKGIGLPDYAREDDDDARTIVCHTRYVLSHNNETKTPDWVFEHLTKKQLGKNTRPKKGFRADENLPKDKAAVDADYRKSKYDRGHQAPSADFSASADLMAESFLLSNIVPQVGRGFNQNIWKRLEDLTRRLVSDGSGRPELYIITGPIYRSDDGRPITITAKANACEKRIVIEMPKRESICGRKLKCEEGVAIPAALFKIIYDPGLKRANAFIMPNINHNEEPDFKNTAEYLRKFQTTVKVVEDFTGLEFFRSLPIRTRRPINEQCATMMLH